MIRPIIGSLLMLLLCGPASAQTEPPPVPDAPGTSSEQPAGPAAADPGYPSASPAAPVTEPPPAPPATTAPPAPPPAAKKPAAKQPAKKKVKVHKPRPKKRKGPRKLMFLIGPGLSLGIFYPSEVNNYMERWLDNQGTVVSKSGFTGMFINIVPRVTMEFLPIEYVGIEVLGELGWGPKIISIEGGDSKIFSFVRYSVGGAVNGYIPLSGGRKAIKLGVGGLFHHMSFEGFSTNTVGFRAQAGYRIYQRIFTPEIFAAFDYAKGDVGTPGGFTSNYPKNLNFTGVIVGVNFYFNTTPNR